MPALVVSLAELPGGADEFCKEVFFTVPPQTAAGIAYRRASEFLDVDSVKLELAPEQRRHAAETPAITPKLARAGDVMAQR